MRTQRSRRLWGKRLLLQRVDSQSPRGRNIKSSFIPEQFQLSMIGENTKGQRERDSIPSGSSQCTSPKHPVSYIKPGLATHFIHDILHVSMPFSQIFPPSPSPTALLPPHTMPLGRPSAPASSIQYRASNLDWRLVPYMILYVF